LVYGALSTHRQTEADKLTIPIFARRFIYETKIVQGFFLPRWFATATSRADKGGRLEKHSNWSASGNTSNFLEGEPFALTQFAEAVALAEGASP